MADAAATLPTRFPVLPPQVPDPRRAAPGARTFPDLLAGLPATRPGATPPDPATALLNARLPRAVPTAVQVPQLPPPPPELVAGLAAQRGRGIVAELGRLARLEAAGAEPPAAQPPVPGPLTNGIFVPLAGGPAATTPAAAAPAGVPAATPPARLADLAEAIAQITARQELTAAVAARTPDAAAAPGTTGGAATPTFAPQSRILIDQRV